MSGCTYDLHIHSCLSPCGDDSMTAYNFAGMAKIKGLRAAALTDHNTCRNCRPFFSACAGYGVVPVPGMELTTAEEIHLLLLFDSLEQAEAFEDKFAPFRCRIPNRPDIFGNQYLIADDDSVSGEYEFLLPPASSLGLSDACELALSFGAAVIPAHIDRPANGIIGILGQMPESPRFGCVELKDPKALPEMVRTDPSIGSCRVITDSDAHYLWDINEADAVLPVDPHGDPDGVRKRIIAYLKGR